MRSYQNFWLILIFIGVIGNPVFAQDGGNSARLVGSIRHVSDGGGFTILLPIDPTAQRRIMPSEGNKGGMQFFWRTLDGEFFVSFYDNSLRPLDSKRELEAMRDNFLSGIVKTGGKLLEKKDIALGKISGLEITAQLQSTEIVIIRYYAVGRRVFILSTRLNSKETGEKQLKTLDSFRLLEEKVKS